MVQLQSFLAALLMVLSCSAIPLTVPLGSTGKSLTVSDDGQTISVGGQTINLRRAMNGTAACQSSSSKGKAMNSGRPAMASATTAKAVYFITNTAKNSIVALKVSANGTLSDGSITPTGGAGLSGIDSSTGKAAAPDSLFSQGAIKVSGNHLLAVNPGSNTVSLFHISPHSPTTLTMIGQPTSTLGEFPISVTISSALSQACVANSGAVAGVSCFQICPTRGLIPLDTAVRPFALGQTTPPSGPLNSVSQIFFNKDSTMLLTTVKGDPTKNNTGFLSMFPVINGTVSQTETRSSPSGTAVLFGTALLPDKNQLFVTDASFGSATLSLPPISAANSSNNNNNQAQLISSTAIKDQKATCWATFSPLTSTAFVTDVAVNHLVEVDPSTGQLVTDFQSSNGNGGMIDLESDVEGKMVFALSPGSGEGTRVVVFDISGGKGMIKEAQNFEVRLGEGLGGGSAQGIALY